MIEADNFLHLTCANPHYLSASQGQLADGSYWQIWDSGILVFEPAQANAHREDLVFSCGIHGDETAPIELCNQVIQSILRHQLPVKQRVMFLIGNPPAINKASRDTGANLNRLFSGAHQKAYGQGSYESRRADQLEQTMKRFYGESSVKRLHYDLHTAMRRSKHERFAIYPFTHGQPWQGQALRGLAASGIEAVLFHHEPTTTFSYFSAQHLNAQAFTIELGRVMPMGQNNLNRIAAMERTMHTLISGGRVTEPENLSDLALYKVRRTLVRQQAHFQFHFADDLANFSEFKQGDKLAEDGDQTIYAEVDGEAVVFPNADVSIGQRACLLVEPALGAQLTIQ